MDGWAGLLVSILRPGIITGWTVGDIRFSIKFSGDDAGL